MNILREQRKDDEFENFVDEGSVQNCTKDLTRNRL